MLEDRNGARGYHRNDASMITSTEFRRLMGNLATGVAVVAARHPETGQPFGLTANSLTSVSLEPPLVLVCVQQQLRSHDCIRCAEHFSVNLLGEHQEEVSRRFARRDGEEKFAGVPFRTGASGAPILEDAFAWLDCRLWASYPGGDHTIYVGEVLAGEAREGRPLLFFQGAYGRCGT